MTDGTCYYILVIACDVLAISLGILKRRKEQKGGIAAIVNAVLAVIMALGLNSLWSNVFKEVHNKAVECKPDGLWAQASEDTNSGLVSIIKKLSRDEANVNALVEELNELDKLKQL